MPLDDARSSELFTVESDPLVREGPEIQVDLWPQTRGKRVHAHLAEHFRAQVTQLWGG